MGKHIDPTDRPHKDKTTRYNQYLYNKIADIGNRTRRNYSATVRYLLYMGIKEWELNQLAGRTTKKAIEADYNRRLAEAQALAAGREARKNKRNKSDTAPAVTPLLYGTEEKEE